jgi:LmbE family N-acetylglucosaminyl deacetylase
MKKRVLIVSPHPDDETLGAGGAAAKFVSMGSEVSVLTVSGHLPPLYDRQAYETTVEEALRAFAVLGVSWHRFLEIPATMVGQEPVHKLNERISSAVVELEPEVVLCPYPDRHIDHRVIFESVMVATRPVGAGAKIEILAAYETLSETHWNAPHIEPNFVPNWVIDISRFLDKKLQALGCYRSQISGSLSPRSIDAVEGLAKFRGSQAGFVAGEGFHIIRMKS